MNELEIIQTLGAILIKKGIKCFPVNTDFLDAKIAPNQESLVIQELLIVLEEYGPNYQHPRQVRKLYEIFGVPEELIQIEEADNQARQSIRIP